MDIYQHFRKEEQPFIDHALSWIRDVEMTYQPKLTDFLDPREQQIVDMLAGTSLEDLQVCTYGGSPAAERKRVMIAPMYETITEDSFHLALLQASYHNKFISITHRDVMGAFLSLGVKRKKLGDITVADGQVQMITTDEIAMYIRLNLTAIKKASISLEEKPLSAIIESETTWVPSDYIVSSLRLDTVLKSIYKLSRKHAAEMITKGLVKVNHKVADDKKFTLEEGDILSLRGKGRSKLVRINGYTKKDNISITAAVLK
ncbi:YlmH family RNA-binding protein [Lentibacillus cibarius]|uniref:RNA-binding protein n=1 Tax=Lentibacillus cibarius TaxID=2583219 RepID=A0A5S3QPA5_9BACI|nr:RNA-binding protein [Lentibacillus cibarius]TMN23508.1 RNA-binding protein [Lentibacillus cibarius]